ncbi:MAG: thioredoxin family protein [Weeksellaceae bacterium]|jgi:hypothetical protein|nr:thioredoxin family protein [Weeksellaceae bacterium]MDX9704574.1 thioredoxin family protein [Weeksellaceae bacterium]
MKKVLIFTFLTVFLFGCEGPYIFNRVVNLKSGDKMLLGGVSREAFLKPPFKDWYQAEYDAYQPSPAVLKQIKSKIKRCRIEVFMGTWNDSSKVYYPRLVKILDETKFPKERMLTYAVNENKRSFYSEERGKNIEQVPTILIYKGGKEIGRIVESPSSGSLEETILAILTGKYSE